MDEQKRAKIEKLAEDAHQKRLRYQMLSEQNMAGLSAEEMKQCAIAHAMAGAEYHEAYAMLEMATNPGPCH